MPWVHLYSRAYFPLGISVFQNLVFVTFCHTPHFYCSGQYSSEHLFDSHCTLFSDCPARIFQMREEIWVSFSYYHVLRAMSSEFRLDFFWHGFCLQAALPYCWRWFRPNGDWREDPQTLFVVKMQISVSIKERKHDFNLGWCIKNPAGVYVVFLFSFFCYTIFIMKNTVSSFTMISYFLDWFKINLNVTIIIF